MQNVLLVVALVSGLATVLFIASGLRRAIVRHKPLGMRALVATTVLSLITCAFTIWQLILSAQQLGIGH